MKVSLNWVREFVDIDLSVDELVTKIGAQLGAVEEVIDISKKYQGIIIAKVVSCEKHPNADKLSVCMIDDGEKSKAVKRDKNGLVQVVCGAPNVRAGMLVAWLPPGATVPSSYDKEPFVLEAREIRGQVSNGMLASSQELALGDDHSGILEVDDGNPGDDFAVIYKLDDHIIDIENKMFTHRPDCFGIIGIAREIAGITGVQFKSPVKYLQSTTTGNNKSGLKIIVDNTLPELVPRFVAQAFGSVQIKSSSIWLQSYLSRSGVRPINNIVDLTNYIMILTGQPMHAYDYDKLLAMQARVGSKEQGASLETRLSKKGDKLKLLNGKTIAFEDNSTILITSGGNPVGIAGVMGGAETEVDNNTTRIVLECANFNMYSIRRTSMKYGLFTDAVTRFNKGQSAEQCDKQLSWASELITSVSGAKPGVRIDNYSKPITNKLIRASIKFINSRLGLELTRVEMSKLLTIVEFEVDLTDNKDEMKITPPFWRTDIEITEDIVEEIGRLYGYDHLPLVLPKRSIKPISTDPIIALKQRIRQILSKSGANEVLTYSFVHGKLLDSVGQDSKLAYKLSNAISPELQYYRLSLSPSLIDKIRMNIKAGFSEFALFEIGKVHGKSELDEQGLPRELGRVSFVYSSKESKGSSFYNAKYFLSQLTNYNVIPFSIELLNKHKMLKQMVAPYDPSRSGFIWNGEMVVGIVGEYLPTIVAKLKLPTQSAGFEIFLSALKNDPRPFYKPMPKYPKVTQDITLQVPTEVNYGKIFDELSFQLTSIPNTLSSIAPIDIYQKSKDSKYANMSFRYTTAHYLKTLTSEEVNDLLDKVSDSMSKKFNSKRV